MVVWLVVGDEEVVGVVVGVLVGDEVIALEEFVNDLDVCGRIGVMVV